jgi:glycerol-3-phosphate dehydrogenase subunit B
VTDVVVIGTGVSGLVAALRCQEAGLSVTVVAKGVGSTHLAPTTIDILGYDPELVESPAASLPGFVARNADHPYARIGVETVSQSLRWFRERFGDCRYTGVLEENLLLPTAIGSLKPTALAPESLAAGDLRAGGRLLFVGLRQLKDFFPALAASNITAAKTPSGADITARAVQIEPPTGGEADLSSLAFARRFDDQEFRRAVITQITAHREKDETVALPAVLGVLRPHEVWSQLQEALECRVVEIPSLPPSVPGIRLYERLHKQFENSGGRMILGAEAVGADTQGDRVSALRVSASARVKPLPARHFVLATGGFGSGAIEMTSNWKVRESVFNLPVAHVPPEGEARFGLRYFDRHPMARAGIRVDDAMHPLDEDGRVVFGNVTVAGACIAGAESWREKSGEGISLSSGYKAAETIIGEAT